tara:strand:+ start:1472 stop:2119 length:648 start_codon:yes stop_codon:yes gene_type:complete
MFYEVKLAQDIDKENKDIITDFKKLIDTDFMKKAFDKNNNFDYNFINIKPENNKEIFTHSLIVTLGKIDPSTYDKFKEYVKAEDTAILKEIIKDYINYSSDIAVSLLYYSEIAINQIQIGLNKVESKFYILLNFLKTQKYPINIIVDTILLVCIILSTIAYLIYYKLYTIILLILGILSIILVVFYNSNVLFVILVLIGFYLTYFVGLYKMFISN